MVCRSFEVGLIHIEDAPLSLSEHHLEGVQNGGMKEWLSLIIRVTWVVNLDGVNL